MKFQIYNLQFDFPRKLLKSACFIFESSQPDRLKTIGAFTAPTYLIVIRMICWWAFSKTGKWALDPVALRPPLSRSLPFRSQNNNFTYTIRIQAPSRMLYRFTFSFFLFHRRARRVRRVCSRILSTVSACSAVHFRQGRKKARNQSEGGYIHRYVSIPPNKAEATEIAIITTTYNVHLILPKVKYFFENLKTDIEGALHRI